MPWSQTLDIWRGADDTAIQVAINSFVAVKSKPHALQRSPAGQVVFKRRPDT